MFEAGYSKTIPFNITTGKWGRILAQVPVLGSTTVAGFTFNAYVYLGLVLKLCPSWLELCLEVETGVEVPFGLRFIFVDDWCKLLFYVVPGTSTSLYSTANFTAGSCTTVLSQGQDLDVWRAEIRLDECCNNQIDLDMSGDYFSGIQGLQFNNTVAAAAIIEPTPGLCSDCCSEGKTNKLTVDVIPLTRACRLGDGGKTVSPTYDGTGLLLCAKKNEAMTRVSN